MFSCTNHDVNQKVSYEKAGSIRVNRIALLLLMATATTLGVAPVTLAIGRPHILIYIFISTLIVAAYKTRSFKTSATEKPGSFEYILGGVGAIFPAASTGLVWLTFYWFVIGIIKLFEFIATWLNFEMQLNAELIAFYSSLIMPIAVGILLISQGADNLAQQLYPQTAGLKSVFYELITYGRKKLLTRVGALLVFVGAVIPVAVTTGAFTTWWFNLCSLGFLLLTSLSLSTMGVQIPTEKSDYSTKAISKLFTASGYQVFSSPRTGTSEIDPLLVSLDLFAQKKEHGFAIDVYTSTSKSMDPVMSMNDLLIAAVALESFQISEGTPVRVIPMIVFIGAEVNDEVRDFSQKEAVQIVEISDMEAVNRILKIKSEEELRKMARHYLGIPDKVEDLIDSVTDSDVQRGEAQ